MGLSKNGFRMFNNPVGKRNLGTHDAPRFLTFGLTPGSGDLIGWLPLQIEWSCEHKALRYGQIAVFVSIETKGVAGKARPDQYHWSEVVNNQGGFAVIVWQPHDNPTQQECDLIAEGIHHACLTRYGLEGSPSTTPQEDGQFSPFTGSKEDRAAAGKPAANHPASIREPDTD